MNLRRFGWTIIMLAFASATVEAKDEHWIASWASSPLGGKIVIPGVPPDKIPPSPVVRGTVRFRLPLSAGGSKLQLRLSNEANNDQMSIGAVTVGVAEAGLTMRAGTMRSVQFNGRSSLTIPVGAPALSDPVELPTAPTDALIVSLYLTKEIQLPLGQRGIQAAVLETADATSQLNLEGAHSIPARTPVSAVLVASSSHAETIVTLGDSITDGGVTDTPDVRGWPGHLAKRLQLAGQVYGVANEGIGGNAIITDIIGPNALARFDRDVLSLPNVAYLVLLEGINDIGFSNAPDNHGPSVPVDAERLIGAYQQLITRAHQHGIRVVGCTLPPFQGAMYYSDNGDKIRHQVNDWIRSSHGFDAFVDFDRALGDPADNNKLNAVYDSGDHLHPSDAGYTKMAEALDLKQFSK